MSSSLKSLEMKEAREKYLNRMKTNKEDRAVKKPKIEDYLICPILHELPWDPVTAEDGLIYERKAIEKHIKIHQGPLKSPMTNKPMGSRLLAAPKIKSMIEALVMSGFIAGTVTANWNENYVEQKNKEELLKKARGGDTKAMANVGIRYEYGKRGFEMNRSRAYEWYHRAHEAGHVPSTAYAGRCLLMGWGVEKNSAEGMALIKAAAGQGSKYAAYIQGMAFANGRYGIRLNKEKAIHWLQRCLSNKHCKFDDLSAFSKETARKTLKKLSRNEIDSMPATEELEE